MGDTRVRLTVTVDRGKGRRTASSLFVVKDMDRTQGELGDLLAEQARRRFYRLYRHAISEPTP